MRIIMNPRTTAMFIVVLLQVPAVVTAQESPAPAPGARPASVVDLRGQLGTSINNAGA